MDIHAPIFWAAARLAARHANPVGQTPLRRWVFSNQYLTPQDGGAGGGDRFARPQDIVFDAWKTDVLPAEERGAGAAISVLGYRLGMLVSGGLALWLADKWLGWQGVCWLMAAC